MPLLNPIEFKYLPISIIILAVLGVGMTAVSLFAAFESTDDVAQAICWLGVPFFAACVILSIVRLMRDRKNVTVRLTGRGFTDIRLALEEIP